MDSKIKNEVDLSRSPREVAIALLEMRPRPRIIPEALRRCLSLHVIHEFVRLASKPWERPVDAEFFRDDMRFCSRLVGWIADGQERAASSAIILMTLFDWNWLRAYRGERGAARRAWRLLHRVNLPKETLARFPMLGVQFLLRQARLARISNAEEAVLVYKETLDWLQELTGLSGNKDMPRANCRWRHRSGKNWRKAYTKLAGILRL